jgi:hypothetical protein
MTITLPAWLPWALLNVAGLAVIAGLLWRFLVLVRRRSVVWLVGRHVRGNHWDVQGIFYRRESAVAACKSPRYFLFPVDFDRALPEETTVPFKLEYPKREDQH